MTDQGPRTKDQGPLSIVVIGASGDLARKKVFPALFSLYCQGLLPPDLRLFGFARTPFTDESFREQISENLACRYVRGERECGQLMEEFLGRCHYVAGPYDSADAFLDLYQRMGPLETQPANRMYFLSIPPDIFVDVARAIGDAGLVTCGTGSPWSRIIIEKPFGSDRTSSDVLTREMGTVFAENQTYRIDHYLGKEVIQNLMVLRFANRVFEPVWNRSCIRRIDINWKENIGIEGRAGYFDRYGIIRDVVQNHMLQILALVAMEKPSSSDAQAVRDAKVAALRCVPPLQRRNLVIGQYEGYREEPGVPADSVTPTYARARLAVDNERWRGVPFVITAGKGLDTRINEVRIRFRAVEENLFAPHLPAAHENDLVIRIQPDPDIQLRIVNKVPGLDMELAESLLDLRYASTFDRVIPEAYETLLLDVIRGDKHLFIRSDELEAAWDIFTPALHELDQERAAPAPYGFGSAGPADLEIDTDSE